MAEEHLSLPGEIWKRVDLPYVVEHVEVSTFGRVRKPAREHMGRNARCKVPFVRKLPERLVNQILRVGYPSVSLKNEKGRRPYIGVHVLVCATFVGQKPTPDHEVAHWDGDPLNPGPFNLRWATVKENAADRRRHGRAGSYRLSPSKVRDIRLKHERDGMKIHELSTAFRVSQSTICSVITRKTWKNIA